MNRFIRLDTMWDASAWLIPLAEGAQLVWIKLLCYVKNAGREGRAKALVPLMASRMWNVGEESVRQLLYAAEHHGALEVQGQDWVLTKWDEYQGDATAAERKRRQREREKEPCHGTSRVTPVSSREKETEKETETEKKPPIVPQGTFERSWEAYPKRKGSNPKQTALVSYERALKRGATPESILAGVKAYSQSDPGERGAEFIAQAATWLNQRRWEDDYSVPDEQERMMARLREEFPE